MYRPVPARRWRAAMAALGIVAATLGASAGTTAIPTPQTAKHLTAGSGTGDCSGDQCGLNHNQILL